jgi:hypothetical protein
MALRDAGWLLGTMDERYGAHASQLIRDVQWIEEATDHGGVLLTKDLRIASYLLGNQNRLFQMASRAAGPYVVSVGKNSLRRVPLNLHNDR